MKPFTDTDETFFKVWMQLSFKERDTCCWAIDGLGPYPSPFNIGMLPFVSLGAVLTALAIAGETELAYKCVRIKLDEIQ